MRTLRRGDTGSEVRTLQTALTRAGYDPGTINGIFGSDTERAVRQFQRVLGLTVDGIVGPRTWAFLMPFVEETDPDVLRRGSRGNLVRIAQNALKAAGNDPGSIDGLFGTATQRAVQAFQRANNLSETGVIDVTTWEQLAPYADFSTVRLSRGDRGALVTVLQRALVRAGFDPGTVDGIFGYRTRAAVIAFQNAKNLQQDGIVGPRTWTALRPYLAGSVTYTVKRGDTLSAIARQFGTTVEALALLNGIEDPDLIYPGEILLIPGSSVPGWQP